VNTRMNRDRFHIGTYSLRPCARTEKHVRELAECGIDFAIGVDRDGKLLDLFEKYGIGAVVAGAVPGWFGGTGSGAGTMAEKNPPEAYLAAAGAFRDHPAIWGIDVGDEPSCLDFPHYGRVAALVERTFEKQFAYLNLYASYGMVATGGPAQAALELGTESYAEYLREYCRRVPLDYLCFDHYMFTTDWERLTGDLRTASSVAGEYGRDLWIVLQVNSREPDVYLSEKQLSLQAFTALAFGVRCISWACYTPGWWHNHVLDKSGEKTEQYEKLKRVNSSILRLSDVYMRYRRKDTLQLKPGEACGDWGRFRQIRAGEGGALLLATLADSGEDKALFLTAGWEKAKLRLWTDRQVRFTTGENSVLLSPEQDGVLELTVPACGGGILTGA